MFLQLILSLITYSLCQFINELKKHVSEKKYGNFKTNHVNSYKQKILLVWFLFWF